jgi:hypothetical protein
MTYEEMTRDHVSAIRRLSGFLGVELSEHALDSIPEAQRWFKHSPKGLCNAVADYKAFCSHYSKTTYAQHLADPCEPGVWNCCSCKAAPAPRVFPDPMNKNLPALTRAQAATLPKLRPAAVAGH